jgi:SET domain-containing protein
MNEPVMNWWENNAPPGGPEPRETEYLLFRQSDIHGLGAFARCDIVAGTRIIEYLGEKIDKPESLRRCQRDNQYIFSLGESYDLDGNVPWNPARFINHSCEPNCVAELEEERIWIIAARDIRAGEEVTFNYGYDLVDYKQYRCSCGSPGCIGYMVAPEFHEHVKARNRE